MFFERQILNMYKGMMHTRCDDTETVFYFSAEDFDGLNKESYAFKASAGHKLQGYIYQYASPMPNRLVVFDHGFGGGHRAYMKEINMLCKHGYTVFAYDHTGCMESGGASPGGLAQSLCDLNDCICAIKANKRYKECTLSVVGHSWGAFSTMNISALHPEITHIVALCGFVSVEEMIKTFFSGPMKGYQKAVLALEQTSNPHFVSFDALKSLSNTKTKALLIYSEDDHLCRRLHYDILHKGIGDQKNVTLMLVKNKDHNPNYTEDAVKLLGAFGKARAKFAKKKNASPEEKAQFVASFDWNAMTEQDETVWRTILAHLDDK
jgi:pimeloyl-ACP methyl ester carboxylesterase